MNIRDEIISFYNDTNFQYIKSYYGRDTIFNILKIERNENRHSAFLAWLLDNTSNHGLGDEPLKCFMRLLAKNDENIDAEFLYGNYHVENMSVETEKSIDSEKKGRIDIYIQYDVVKTTDNKNDRESIKIILENKIDTAEHDEQTKSYISWVRNNNNNNARIIGVFLTLEKCKFCSGDCDNFNYIKLSYQDVLSDVIEPVLHYQTNENARIILNDYIVNLGQPCKSRDDKHTKDDKLATIIAFPASIGKRIMNLFENHRDLLVMSLFVNNYGKNKDELKRLNIFYNEYRNLYRNDTDWKQMLTEFWKHDDGILRIILYYYFKDVEDEQDVDIEKLLQIKKPRYRKKYILHIDGKPDMYKNMKPLPKSLASHEIFQAWLNMNPNATLEDLRNAFPVEKIIGERIDDYAYQYVFYKIKDGMPDFSDETKQLKKKLWNDWYFYLGKDKHLLKVAGEDVFHIKYWYGNEFENLMMLAGQLMIKVEEYGD